jgi:hypothetical protein
LNFNTCPQTLPIFWNGWCFPNQFAANRAAAAAGESFSFNLDVRWLLDL